jgi:hypothetical protein
MFEPLQEYRQDAQPPDIALPVPRLPAWLARRLLRPGEHVLWVRGPRRNPWAERWLTHPALFLLALALGTACLVAGRLLVRSWSDLPVLPGLAAAGLVLGSVFVLAISNAYFTRLVVTNYRLLIVQGYEVCHSWGLDDLPRSLVRYDMREGRKRERSVDLTALQTLLGEPSGHFAEAKTILALGKHLGQIKAREDGRP